MIEHPKRFKLAGRCSGLILVLSAGPALADGLGGLQGAGILALMVGLLVGGSVIAALIQLISLAGRDPDKEENPSRTLTTVSVIYLLLVAPVFIGIVVSPNLKLLHYGIAALYLFVLFATLIPYSPNKRLVYALVGALSLVIVMRTPEIISYTKYEYIENQPLEWLDPLAEQKDSQLILLADGRIFRLDRAYTYYGSKKLTADDKVMFKESRRTDESPAYTMYKLQFSSRYGSHKRFDPEPLIRIPLKHVSMEMYEIDHVDTAELLPENWRATERDIGRHLYHFCCDAEWFAELVRRGADAKAYRVGSRNLLHVLAAKDLEKVDYASAAAVFIDAGVELNIRDEWGSTPLDIVVGDFWGATMLEPDKAEAYKTFVKLLLESGADPNLYRESGRAPLHWALWHKNYWLADTLLEYGADPTLEFSGEESALEYAKKRYESMRKHYPDDLKKHGVQLKKILDAMRNATAVEPA